MKKIIKIFLIVLSMLSVSFISMKNFVYAGTATAPMTYVPNGSVDRTFVIDFGSKLSQVLTVLGVIIAVIALMIIGLKFILGSVTEKAEYKKSLMPVVIGIFIIATITGIVTLFANIGDNLNNDAKQQVNEDFIGPRQPNDAKQQVNEDFIGPRQP